MKSSDKHTAIFADVSNGGLSGGRDAVLPPDSKQKLVFAQHYKLVSNSHVFLGGIADKHIILIGFKHVGKSVIGRMLALRMNKAYIDLDLAIERLYQRQHQIKLNCKEIVKNRGEAFFRNLEQETLRQVIQRTPCIISTGGGTPMRAENYQLMAAHCIVHITAKPQQVFDRIMKKGRPAFFPPNEDPWVTFQRLWQEREKVYQKLATFSVENNGSVAVVVEQIVEALKD